MTLNDDKNRGKAMMHDIDGSNGSILELKDVTKSFGGIHALQGININIQKGAIVGLIGPNGAGKTTLFNMISGFLGMDRGEIRFNQKEISRLYPYDRSRLGIGRTFQLPKIFNNMSVLDNVLIGALQKSSDVNESKQVAMEILRDINMDTIADSFPGDLPIASRKKLEICRALASSPTLLLLDEAISGLTPKETLEMIDLIEKLSAKGITLLIIEHVMKFIMNISQWIVVLNYGQKIAEGTPEEIARNETVIDAYLGKKELSC
ncbi:MAG TPA: ABC transporter ATP-binding protein [Syntrophorhabdus sp.]|nr:ABC transporter ATP-binding protein [Syntrophorhabdus sp.]